MLGGAVVASALAAGRAGLFGALAAPSGSYVDGLPGFRTGEVQTRRHRTFYIESGPRAGPLMIFLHGFPEIGVIWKAQMAYFAERGWRCIAPDMRGYGGSSAPTEVAAYTVREIATDMVELHDALGGAPAIWVGHDWGAPIAWTMASHHPERCRGVIGLSVPYLPRGHVLPQLVPLVDRQMYPVDRYPVGQWDYWLYYRESFALAQRDFETDTAGAIAALYRSGNPDAIDKPSVTATLREKGGWFGPAHQPPAIARDERILSQADYDLFVTTFRRTGFRSGIAWYLHDTANSDFAGEARDFGRLSLPVLFLHSEYDPVDETLRSRLAEPMRQDCTNLTEAKVASGHFIMLEQKEEVCRIMAEWLARLPKPNNEVRKAPSTDVGDPQAVARDRP